MKKLFLFILIFIISLNCGRRDESTKGTRVENEAVTVKIAAVKEMIIAEQIKMTGEIAPIFQVDVFPRANGIVVSESVSLGDEVRKDQVLAEVQQDIPGMEFSNVKIEATTGGFVTSDLVEIGTRISVQSPIYTISGLRPIYMIAKVMESYLGQIKIGDDIAVEVDAYPVGRFNGRIAEISPIVDPISRTAEIKIALNNSKLQLKPGMFARAYLTVGSHSGLIVPLDAIVRTGANRYIFKIEAGRAKQVRVETGVIMQDEIEIQGNIKVGDQVVILGQNLLEDSVPVRTAEGN